MKVALIAYSVDASKGGIQTYLSTILKHLTSAGHTTSIITLGQSRPSLYNRILNLLPFKHALLHVYVFLLDKILGFKPDLILCGHVLLCKHASNYARLWNTDYCLFAYGIDSWSPRLLDQSLYMYNLNTVISISDFTSAQVRLQKPDLYITKIPPVLLSHQIPPYVKPSRKSLSTLNLLTVGRLSSSEGYKGQDQVIRAIKHISKISNLNIHYHIVGEGDDLPRLKELASMQAVEGSITFHGFLPSSMIYELYSQSDIFVMPSRVSLHPQRLQGEGFGIVFLEAAMYSVPIIGPNEGGSNDFIKHAVTGLRADPHNSRDIADKIIDLAFNYELRCTLSLNAYDHLVSSYTTNSLDHYMSELVHHLGSDQSLGS